MTDKTNQSANQNSSIIDRVVPSYADAHHEQREQLLAMPPNLMHRVPRLDGAASADKVDASAEKVQKMRPAIVAQFGEEAGHRVDRLVSVARSMMQAEIDYQRTDASGSLRDMHAEVSAKREVLWNDLKGLANRNLIHERELSAAEDIQGYDAITKSTLMLVSLAREKWALVEAHTRLTKDEVDSAATVAQDMRVQLSRRDGGVDRGPAAEVRNRALVALVAEYEEVRRMVGYLRWYEDDLEEIAPSLWQRRSRSSGDGEQPPPQEPTNPTAPVPTDDGGPFTP